LHLICYLRQIEGKVVFWLNYSVNLVTFPCYRYNLELDKVVLPAFGYGNAWGFILKQALLGSPVINFEKVSKLNEVVSSKGSPPFGGFIGSLPTQRRISIN
jgi:hypothetical protein